MLTHIMTRYNNNRFTPGNKGNLRLLINKILINQHYQYDINKELLCGCIQQQSNLTKQGWNDPSQTENMRISQILTGTLGGRTTFGNFNNLVKLTYLGGWEGQPGGSPQPLKNRF
jgi:hypothetical protein